jgi:hypothetical protein
MNERRTTLTVGALDILLSLRRSLLARALGPVELLGCPSDDAMPCSKKYNQYTIIDCSWSLQDA